MVFNLPEELFIGKRVFQYDYIYVDALFLLLWIGFLLRRKEARALIFAAAIAPIIYAIDALVWWNRSAGPHYPPGTHIREYWIGGVQVGRPQGEMMVSKFGADFMMTISYSFFAFAWLWLMFRQIRENRLFSKDSAIYTCVWLCFWMLVPAVSRLVWIDNQTVTSIRYMYSQFPLWTINFLVGYVVLIAVYRKRLRVVGQLFLVGAVGSLVMELPLYAFGIRPTSFVFLIFEGIFLLNQGVPWLFLLVDKVLVKEKVSDEATVETRA